MNLKSKEMIVFIVIVIIGIVVFSILYMIELTATNIYQSWSSQIINNQFDLLNEDYYTISYDKQELKTSEKINALRDFSNRQYDNYQNSRPTEIKFCHFNETKYEASCEVLAWDLAVTEYEDRHPEINYSLRREIENSTEETEITDITNEYGFLYDFSRCSAGINLIEYVFFINEDIILESETEIPISYAPIEETISKIQLLDQMLIVSGSLSSMIMYPINVVNTNNGDFSEFLNELERLTDEKINLLPEFMNSNPPKCPSTQTYIDVKNLELGLRESLDNTTNPFSIIPKIIWIEMIDNCSKKIDFDCPLIPNRRDIGLDIISDNFEIFRKCAFEVYLREKDIFNERLVEPFKVSSEPE